MEQRKDVASTLLAARSMRRRDPGWGIRRYGEEVFLMRSVASVSPAVGHPEVALHVG